MARHPGYRPTKGPWRGLQSAPSNQEFFGKLIFLSEMLSLSYGQSYKEVLSGSSEDSPRQPSGYNNSSVGIKRYPTAGPTKTITDPHKAGDERGWSTTLGTRTSDTPFPSPSSRK
jgi:hypothetical protein